MSICRGMSIIMTTSIITIMSTITTIQMTTMTIVTNPIIMPTKWQSQQQNRQFMIIPTIMVTPTTITPAWQVFPISSSI